MTTRESIPFEELQGKVLKEVSKQALRYGDGPSEYDTVLFVTEGGERYVQLHDQDCCESVTVEDICGDLEDLIGTPIILAAEATNANAPSDESATWTFYNLGTVKGYVTIRWYGISNGYYSERVSFYKEVDD